MFLCDTAKETVFTESPHARNTWETLERQKKRYTWPDRTVVFDTPEKLFLDAGYQTALMYLHNSPGLLRIKRMPPEKRSALSP